MPNGSSKSTKESIYSLICRYQPVARSDIADLIGLTRASVSNAVKELLKLKLIKESKKIGESVGRKKVLLKLNPDSIHVAGINIGRRGVNACIYNACGKLLKKEEQLYPMIRPLEAHFKDIDRILNKMLRWAKKERINIDAMGIGMPGPVDSEKGIYSASHFLKKETVNIKETMEKKYEIPVFVERDVNAAVLGERWFGEGRKCRSFVYLLLVEGIGAGAVLDGHLYRGAHGLAGKVGRSIFPGIDGKKEVFSLEEFGSEASALRMARENALKNKEGYLYQIAKTRELTVNDLIEGVRQRDSIAIDVANTLIYYAAITVANLTLFFDPNLIILSGDLTGIIPGFVQKVQDKSQQFLKEIPLPKLKVSQFYNLAISLGAATRAISEVVSEKVSG